MAGSRKGAVAARRLCSRTGVRKRGVVLSVVSDLHFGKECAISPSTHNHQAVPYGHSVAPNDIWKNRRRVRRKNSTIYRGNCEGQLIVFRFLETLTEDWR